MLVLLLTSTLEERPTLYTRADHTFLIFDKQMNITVLIERNFFTVWLEISDSFSDLKIILPIWKIILPWVLSIALIKDGISPHKSYSSVIISCFTLLVECSLCTALPSVPFCLPPTSCSCDSCNPDKKYWGIFPHQDGLVLMSNLGAKEKCFLIIISCILTSSNQTPSIELTVNSSVYM